MKFLGREVGNFYNVINIPARTWKLSSGRALLGSEKLFGSVVGVAGDTQNTSGGCRFAVQSLVWRRVEEGELICPLPSDTNKPVNVTQAAKVARKTLTMREQTQGDQGAATSDGGQSLLRVCMGVGCRAASVLGGPLTPTLRPLL